MPNRASAARPTRSTERRGARSADRCRRRIASRAVLFKPGMVLLPHKDRRYGAAGAALQPVQLLAIASGRNGASSMRPRT
jgi:hypothetical protein